MIDTRMAAIDSLRKQIAEVDADLLGPVGPAGSVAAMRLLAKSGRFREGAASSASAPAGKAVCKLGGRFRC